MTEPRKRKLDMIRQTLNSEGGEELIEELKATILGRSMLGTDPQHTAYNVGQRELYEHILKMYNGEY